ncbi:MAG: hypothetical protein SFU83_22180 [Meiothermus sp.]|nr:hypothetical protein [Meiothermus sp.]
MWLSALRWLLTLPSAVVGFFLSVQGTLALVGLLENLCVGGSCTDWKFLPTGVSIYLGITVAAVAVVLLPTLIAPAHKHHTALVFYALGAVAAFWMVTFTGEPFMLLTALVAGGVTTWRLWLRFGGAR